GTGLNSYPGLFVVDGCPGDTMNGHCMGSSTAFSNGDTVSDLTLVAGRTYYIIVDNNAALSGTNYMPFNFHITTSATAAPLNDLCGSAISLGTVPINATC